MDVHVHRAGEEGPAGGVEHLAPGEPPPDDGDLLAVHGHVGLEDRRGRDDSAVLDD